MPLLSNKLYVLNKIKKDNDGDESNFRHNLTNEICETLDELNRKIFLYNQKIWTCRVTGQFNLTFKEALISEQNSIKLLKMSFKTCFEALVLHLVHHSKESLEILVHKSWTQIHEEFCIDEPVDIKLKSPREMTLKGIIVKIDRHKSEDNNDRVSSIILSSESSISDKENITKKIVSIKKEYFYNVKIREVEKLVKDVPAEIIERTLRPPSKDQIRMFICAHAVRYVDQPNDGWIVDDEMVKKYQLPNSEADFAIDNQQMKSISRSIEMDVYNSMKKVWGCKAKIDEICVDLTNSDDEEINEAEHRTEKVNCEKEIKMKSNIFVGLPRSGSIIAQQGIAVRSLIGSPIKLIPPIAHRLMKMIKDNPNDVNIKPLIFKCCQLFSVQQINKFPDAVKSLVLERKEKFEESKRIEAMTPEEREAFMLEKRNQLKAQILERRREENVKIEDTEINGKSIPVGSSIIVEDGLNEEQWSRLLSISEFVRSYRRLLFSSDNNVGTESVGVLRIKELCRVVICKSDRDQAMFAELVSVLLKTLLQDNQLKKRRELGIYLSEVPVTAYNSAELLRLVLPVGNRNENGGKRETKNNDEIENENEEDNEQSSIVDRDIEDMSEELPSHDKITGPIFDKLKSHDLHQLSIEERIVVLELLQGRILELELISNFIEEFQREVCEAYKKKLWDTKELNDKLKVLKQTRLSMYRSVAVVQETKHSDIAVVNEKDIQEEVVKSRRETIELKLKDEEENERRLERQRQYENLDKEEQECRRLLEKNHRDYENLMTDAKLLTRVQPLGCDRSYRRYWHFCTAPGAIFVEDEIHEKTETFSWTGEPSQTVWTMYITIEEIMDLRDSLCDKGVRESALKQELVAIIPKLKEEMTREAQSGHGGLSEKLDTENGTVYQKEGNNDVTMKEESFLISGFKHELNETELSIRSGSLGGVEDYESWEKCLKNTVVVDDLKRAMITVFSGVHERFWNGTLKSDSRRKEFLIAIQQTQTLSRLNMLHSILDVSVCWQKSADDDDNCRVCRTNSHENKLLLCDSCNHAFHIFCLRPALKTVPDGEWFCPKCKPPSTVAVVTSKEMEMEKNVEKCSVCQARDDDPLAKCVTCKRAFHSQCHRPVLRQIKRTGWYCNDCKKKEEENHEAGNSRKRAVAASEKSFRDSQLYDVDGSNANESDLNYDENDNENSIEIKGSFREKLRKTRGNVRKSMDNVRKSSTLSVDVQKEEKTTGKRKSNINQSKKEVGIKKIDRSQGKNKKKESIVDDSERSEADQDEQNTKRQTRNSMRNLRSAQKRKIGDDSIDDNSTLITTPRKKMCRTPDTDTNGTVSQNMKDVCEDILRRMLQHKASWPFRYPMEADEFAGYYETILKPMDLSKIAEKCKNGHYGSEDDKGYLEQFLIDIRQIFFNVKEYTGFPDQKFLDLATTLEKFFEIHFRKYDFGIQYSAILSR